MATGGKPPSFPWYPGDSLRDTALMSCRLLARGLWREMIDLMHDGSPYGHLTAGGVAISPAELARLVGEPAPQVRRLLAELEEKKVFSRTLEGVIYCRRMARYGDLHRSRSEAGSRGGLSTQERIKSRNLLEQSGKQTTKQTTKQNQASASALASASAPAFAVADPLEAERNATASLEGSTHQRRDRSPAQSIERLLDALLPTDHPKRVSIRADLEAALSPKGYVRLRQGIRAFATPETLERAVDAVISKPPRNPELCGYFVLKKLTDGKENLPLADQARGGTKVLIGTASAELLTVTEAAAHEERARLAEDEAVERREWAEFEHWEAARPSDGKACRVAGALALPPGTAAGNPFFAQMERAATLRQYRLKRSCEGSDDSGDLGAGPERLENVGGH